jgi:hypothetical protein
MAAMLLCGSAIADTASSAILLAVEQQRIGSITPSVPAAGLDPAYVPGLTPPRPDADGSAETVPEQAESAEPAADAADATAEQPPAEDGAQAPTEEDAKAEPESGSAASDDAEAASEDADDAETDAETDGADAGAPAFEASDRRGAIVVDRVGVRFSLDEEEADFTWDEIAAVEIDTPRFGRRFSVTVYTPERRWYDAQVEATSRGQLKEWTAQLDTVLDLYFEDEAEKAAKADAEAEAEAATEAETEAAEDADVEPADTEKPAGKEEPADADESEPSAEAEPAPKS